MSRIRQKGTAPELAVRALLKQMGVEFSTNSGELPGSPDIYNREGKRAVFINGCFWHRHAGCSAATMPKNNAAYWSDKLAANLVRDRRKSRALRRLGYRILTVWECELKSPERVRRLERRLDRFFRELVAKNAGVGSGRANAKKQVSATVGSGRALTSTAAPALTVPERYTYDGTSIHRTVLRRDGGTHTTSFDVRPLAGKKPQDPGALAALADMAFLREEHWPSLDATAKPVRSVDLFSGCGVMTLGAWEACRAIGHRLEAVLAVDLNPIALRTYKACFPNAITRCENIETLLDGNLGAKPTKTEQHFVATIGSVDFLIGGPPCQGHSDLNNHTRRVDPKNGLYERMARFAELVEPTHIFIENVSAVLHDQGRVVARTADALKLLGYCVDHGVIDAADLGVPQHRKRHVLIASLKRPIDLVGLVSHYSRPSLTVGEAIGDLRRRVGCDSAFDRAGSPTRKSERRIKYLFDNNVHDLPNRLRPKCHRLETHTYKSIYGRMYWDRPAQTITTGFTCMGQGRYVHPKEQRTITPHEAARLQFIPDFFRFDKSCKRTSLAEMIGNAVPPKLTYVAALELLR